jgi:DNA polymerase III epsilon subunit-like protein
MHLLCYDTETTGLPDWNRPSLDPKQPHLVQLALIMCDETGAIQEQYSVIVKPEGWTISPEVTAIHGISHERALTEGVPEIDAATMYLLALARADLRVAHNEIFDRRIMRIAMLRAGIKREVIELLESRPAHCTCEQAKPIMKMPPTNKMAAKGMTQFKPPKLTEAIQFFFKEELAGAHDAMVDAHACMRLWVHLQSLKAAA